MEMANFKPVGVEGRADFSVEEGLPGRCIWEREKFDGGLGRQVPLGGTRDLVLTFTKTCSAAETKGGQHAHLAPEGGAGLLIELGLQVATACSGWCLGTTKLARGWANHEGVGAWC